MCPLNIKLINILTVISGVSEGSVGSLLYLGIFPGRFLILLATWHTLKRKNKQRLIVVK